MVDELEATTSNKKVKLSNLKVPQLNRLLLNHGLAITGNKQAKIFELIKILRTDEIQLEDIPSEELNIEDTENDMVTEVNSLKQTMELLANTMCTLSMSVQNVIGQTPQTPENRSHTYSVREITEMLPEFNPLHTTNTASQFMTKTRQLQQAYGWADTITLFAAQQRLRGVAKTWLDAQPAFISMSAFESAILADFPSGNNAAECHKKMIRRKRGYNENYIQYYYEMLTIGKRGNLDDQMIITYIIDGINDTQLAKTLAVMNFQSCKDLLASLENVGNRPTNENIGSLKCYKCNKNGHIAANCYKTQNQTQDTLEKSNNKNTQIKEITCYNCNEKGHFSRACPKPQRKERCSHCQRTTHTSENCYQRPENKSRRNNVNTIIDSEDTYKDVIKLIKVNNTFCKAFMDTGSAISLIRQKFANSLTVLEDTYKVISGFAGGRYIATKKVNAEMEIDSHIYKTILYVVPDEDLPEEILLGRDILCTKNSRLIIEAEKSRIEVMSLKNSDVTEDFHNDLKKIIDANTKCFADNIADLGKCSTEKLEIKLTTEQPIYCKPYRIPYAKREIVTGIINELLSFNIIRNSTSNYASPIVVVNKKNGEHRMCVDYRQLNKITVKTPFPMPQIEEQFTQLTGNHYFTTLDLRMGYHQIEVHEDSRKFTAFVTTDGQYEFNRMPFGLVNAPAVFQRIMNTVIKDMGPGNALAYLDDVIIPSKTIKEGLERLEKFLKLLATHGLTLRRDKCRFLQKEIEHLGHKISANGIKPGENKIMAIKNFKAPENITEVRRFLGLTGFFRKFVRDYAIITKPITNLLKKENCDNFEWNNDQHTAFRKLIDILTEAPILELYDVDKKHEVHTDACAIGLAGMLLQSSDEKNWKPVMYFSRHCTIAEQGYHSYELEVLAVVETVERFRLYLVGKPFHLITDCAAIALSKEQRELKPRIARWWMKLMEFNYAISHREGNRLAHVDAMSRAPVDPPKEPEPAGFILLTGEETIDWVAALQRRDDRAKLIINILSGKQKSAEATQLRKEFKIIKERLYRRQGEEQRLFVPKAVRMSLVKHYHDMGHFSTEKTMQRLQKWFWFPRMRKLVSEYIKSCLSCCYNKTQRCKPEGELYYDTPIPIPFRTLHLDHLGPFIRSKKGNTHLLVISDAFSKFCIIKAVRNTKTIPVINTVNEVISYFGLPLKIVTDRGTAFTSKEFETFCRDNHINHIKTAVRTPRANGQVERANATILNALRTAQDPKNWDTKLGQLQWILNSQKNATTKFTPNELIFNYDINDAVHNHLVAAISNEYRMEELTNKTQTAEQKKEQAVENISNERKKWKKRFDQRHATPTIYKEGDLVVLKYEPAATGESRKLEPKFRGPYMIKGVLGKDRYSITDVPGTQLKTRRFNSIYNSEHLKPWCEGYPEFIYSDDEENNSEEDLEKSGGEKAKCLQIEGKTKVTSYTRPFTVLLEGNIGCGKSTLIKHWTNHLDMHTVEEPVQKWQNVNGLNLLEKLYEDENKWAMPFQVYVMLTMLENHMYTSKKKIKVMERSVYSAWHCFTKGMLDNGHLTNETYTIMHEWYRFLESTSLVQADLILYLRTTPETAFERIQKRARPEENMVSLEYIKKVHELHEDWLMRDKGRGTEVLVIDGEMGEDTITKEYKRAEDFIQNRCDEAEDG